MNDMTVPQSEAGLVGDAIAPATPIPASSSGIECFVAVARHYGVTTSSQQIVHRYGLAAGEPATAKLLRIAKDAGFKAKALHLDWDGLTRLGPVFPLLCKLTDGSTVIAAGFRKEGEDITLAVMDPRFGAGLRFFPRDLFCGAWSGDVVLLKRIHALDDPQQPFSLRWFIPEILRHKKIFRDIAVAAIAMHVLALASPLFFQLVVDKVLVHQGWSTLFALTAGMVIVLSFDALFGWLRQTLLLHGTSKIDIRLATRTFRQLLDLPIEFFDRTTAGVVSRHMQQVEKIRQFLTGRMFLTALDATALFVFIPLLFGYSAKLAILVLCYAAIVGVTVFAMTGQFRARLADLYRAEGERQAMLVEAIHGMRTVKSLAIEPAIRRQWDQKAANAIETHLRVGRISAIAQSLIGFLDKIMMVTVIAIGATDVFDGTLSMGALLAFQMMSGRVVQPLVQMVSLTQDYQETALSIRMLGEIMNAPTERRRSGGLVPVLNGAIAFDDVSFRYPGLSQRSLSGITLDIPAGSMLGVVGKSGSGKSTLTRLLQGLYVPEQGLVRLDGIDMREIDLAHLRRSIGVVLQENFLFRGTIRENIAITRPDAAFEEIVAVAQLAGADEFIERLPQGYETLLEENASNLSGGQRQRLAIARALLTQPRILIFDEATSALDPESEAIVLDNLARIATGRTVIMVSHRLTTLVQCDKIVVLDQGAIVDQAPHDQLLARCDIYRHLWNQQTKNA